MKVAPWNDPNVRWVCEQHPDKDFPHDDCAGPGMPEGDVTVAQTVAEGVDK